VATTRPQISVPLFSARQIILAELCALDLWNGINFQTGIELSTSDEDLLVAFSHPTYAITNGGSTTQSISPIDIENLVRVAQLSQILRGRTPTDYQAGISNFSAKVLPIYTEWTNQSISILGNIHATKAILDWSPTFTGVNTNTQAQGRHRVALCSRILFFAIPELPFFNFSRALSKCFNLQYKAEHALPYFNKIMEIGYHLNWSVLASAQMPQSAKLNEKIMASALKADWWGRRILDIALLLHFQIAHARIPLQTQAQGIAVSRGV
jgi:hypothetical protein